jgi:hypothetical protein
MGAQPIREHEAAALMELVEQGPGTVAAQSGTSRRRSHYKDTRSAVTNGTRLHVVNPGDNAWRRRFRDVFDLLVADITPPNTELSEAQRQLCRRAATLCIMCEKLEGIAAAGEDIDLDLYGRLTAHLSRTFHRLGIKKADTKDVSPLGEALRANLAKEQQEAAERAERRRQEANQQREEQAS